MKSFAVSQTVGDSDNTPEFDDVRRRSLAIAGEVRLSLRIHGRDTNIQKESMQAQNPVILVYVPKLLPIDFW